MRRILVLTYLLIINCYILIAQNETDALRYSSQNLFGSARFVSMGGTFGALGANLSCASYNPAGIGLYQFNELSITPSFNFNTNTSYFNSNNNEEENPNISFNNLGLVWSKPYKESPWKRINFAVGWNQLNNYNKNIYIEGYNHNNSLVNSMLNQANGISYNQIGNPENGYLYAGPAWGSYLIDTLPQTNGMEYISSIIPNTNKKQTRQLYSNGSSNEFTFSFGTSYQEKIYIGGAIGIPTIYYDQQTKHTEDNFADTLEVLIDETKQKIYGFNYMDQLKVSGYGINLKIGAIFRAHENIKLGAALHSPTIYNMEEEFNTGVITYIENEDPIESYSYINRFEYELLTPWKGILSASANIKNILVGIDYEIVDYAFSRYLFERDYENEEKSINKNIINKYTITNNIRIGAEMRFKFISLRGGYGLYGSPFIENEEYIRKNFTFGIGITNGRYYFDGGYIISMNKEPYLMYGEEYATIANTNHRFVLTLGIKY